MAKESLTVTDNRTGQSYELPIENGTIRALDLRQIKTSDDDFGLMTHDPAFQNTASCKSAITFIGGAKGVLNYRGYPIEELAEHSNFIEVSQLLIDGDLPNQESYDAWAHDIRMHTFVHENAHGALCNSADSWLAGPVERDERRPRAEDRPTATGVRRCGSSPLSTSGGAMSGWRPWAVLFVLCASACGGIDTAEDCENEGGTLQIPPGSCPAGFVSEGNVDVDTGGVATCCLPGERGVVR